MSSVRPWPGSAADMLSSPPSVSLTSRRPCLDCGRDLRGLDVSLDCPECERPIRTSLDARPFRRANAAWAGRVISAAVGLGVATVALGLVLIWLLAVAGPTGPVLAAFAAAAGAGLLAADQLLTPAPEASNDPMAPDRRSTLAARCAGVVIVVGLGVLLIPRALQPGVAAGLRPLPVDLLALLSVPLAVGIRAVAMRVAGLAERVDDERTAIRAERIASVTAWCAGIAAGLVLMRLLLQLSPASTDRDLWLATFGLELRLVMVCAGGLGMIAGVRLLMFARQLFAAGPEAVRAGHAWPRHPVTPKPVIAGRPRP